MGYVVVRELARALIALFYRRVEVEGLDAVPQQGPLVVIANHPNGLVDGLLLLAVLPRRLRPVAKAPLFRNPIVGPFLRLIGAVAVERRQDAGSDPSRNAAALVAAAQSLAGGDAVLIFPEGVSQDAPRLLPLRSGAARLVIAAERALAAAPPEPSLGVSAAASPEGGAPSDGVAVVPVGLSFHRPAEFRTGRALVVVGPRIPTADVVAHAQGHREAAVRELTDRMAAALRALVVESQDRRTLELLGVAHAVWTGGETASDADRAVWSQLALARAAALPPRYAARVRRVRRELERIEKDAALAPPDAYAPAAVLRYAVREGVSLALGAPLALAGLAVHGAAALAVALLVRVLRPDPDVAATYKLVSAAVLFPVIWLAEAIAVSRVGGGTALALFTLLLPVGGFFALAWRDRLARVGRDVRAFARLVADPHVAHRLAERRRWVLRELRTLAAPEE